jgi:hypothetical protein
VSDGIFKTLGTMLMLILVYLLVHNGGGTATVLDAVNKTLTSETKALQGN